MSVLKKLVAQELVQLAPVFVASEEIEEKFAMHGWNACLLRNKFWREMEMQGHVVPEDRFGGSRARIGSRLDGTIRMWHHTRAEMLSLLSPVGPIERHVGRDSR